MSIQQTRLAPLPALRNLGDLADVHPIIVIDSREQKPLRFKRLDSVCDTLTSGDYSFAGGEDLFAVERKSIADLTSCCVSSNRLRFERELHRLRGFHFARLLIVGTIEDIEQHHYRSRIESKSVLHSLAAWEARYNIPVVFTPTPGDAALLVEDWTVWFARELVTQCNGILRGHTQLRKAVSNV